MKKLNLQQLPEIEGGSFWGGLACGIGVGLLLTGVGTPLGIAATAAGCTNMVFY